MTDSVVLRKRSKKPGTHVLVIGVGTYPHLVGGRGLAAPDHYGLGQLTSPPASARAFADWMLDKYENPLRPLTSLRLLLSEAQSQPTFRGTQVLDATIDAIDAVVDDWFADGNTNEDNQLVFYFCGHGLGRNPLLSLLARDFGANHGNPFDGAIDFFRFRTGMNACRAQYQCFFIDACQTNSIDIMRAQYAGRPLRAASYDKKSQPTYYATYAGNVASGTRNNVSYFTSALLDGLNGRGGDRSQGDWRVTTTMLQKAITSYMRRNNLRQRTTADDLDDHFLHWLPDAPDVAVTIDCTKPLQLRQLRLAYEASDLTVRDERAPNARPWLVDLRAGSYQFSATRQTQTVAQCTEFVAPPEQLVPLRRKP